MRLSCLPVSFFSDIIAGRMSVSEWARTGVQAGLDAIDLSILFLPERSLRVARLMRREIEDQGLGVAMITTYPDFTHPNKEQRKRELELACQNIELAAEIGASLVRVTAGQAHPETTPQQGVEWAVEGLSRLVEDTQGFGVIPVYENHAKPGVWTYTDFSQPPEIFLRIVAGTAPCKLGINFDTGNAAAFSADPVGLLDQVFDRVISIHASDSAVKGELRHVLLGTGITPFPSIFACLKQGGWDGWVCMEEASNLGAAGVIAAAGFIRQAWAEA